MGHQACLRIVAPVCGKQPWRSVALAVALSVLGAASADASITLITYRGLVDDGFDQTGIFGTPNGNLAGLAYTAVYTIDDATPGALVLSAPTVSAIYGGTANGNRPTPTSATLTISGHTVSIDGSYKGETELIRPAGFTRETLKNVALTVNYNDNFSVETSRFLRFQTTSLLGFLPGSVLDYRNFMTYNLSPGDFRQVDFNDMRQNLNTGVVEYRNYARLSLTSITTGPVSVEAAVPEPATWALMIGGLGMVGAMLRRQRVFTV